MAFRDFSFPEVQQALGLTLAEADLFGSIPAMELSAEFAERMRSGVDLALAINTEKARSEFIIAPILMELRRQLGDAFGLFSGIEFDVDASRGLNGYCDFILTRSPLQSVLTAPLVAIVELTARIDLRQPPGSFPAQLVELAQYCGAWFSTADGHSVPPDLASLSDAVRHSDAFRFVLDPQGYFREMAGNPVV